MTKANEFLTNAALAIGSLFLSGALLFAGGAAAQGTRGLAFVPAPGAGVTRIRSASIRSIRQLSIPRLNTSPDRLS